MPLLGGAENCAGPWGRAKPYYWEGGRPAQARVGDQAHASGIDKSNLIHSNNHTTKASDFGTENVKSNESNTKHAY